jgi:hypothetical protein
MFLKQQLTTTQFIFNKEGLPEAEKPTKRLHPIEEMFVLINSNGQTKDTTVPSQIKKGEEVFHDGDIEVGESRERMGIELEKEEEKEIRGGERGSC